MVVGWDLGVATATLSYIKPIIDSLLGRHGILPNSHKQGVSGSLPLADAVWEYASTFVLVVLASVSYTHLCWAIFRDGPVESR